MSETEHKAKFTADNTDFNNKADGVAKKGDWLGRKIKAAGAMLAGAFAFGQIIQGFKALIKINADFDKSLANLSAITGATGDDLKFYGKSAREMSKESTFSAMEVVEAYKLMGSARPELLKNKEALAAVTKEALVLSEASGLDLVTATESLAKAMNQFNVPANEAARVINVLAAGSKEGAMEVPGVADAIRNMGTAAAMANISLEQSVAMIETLAEKGFEGAKSGIMLRNVILKLQTGAEKFNPAIVGMSKALENLAAANLSAAQLTDMFSIENQQAAAVLIQNRVSFDNLTTAITGTNVAYEQQAVVLDTLEARWKILKNTIGDVALKTGGLVDNLKKAVTGVTETIQGFQDVGKTDAIGFFGKLALKIGILTGNQLAYKTMRAISTAEDLKAKAAVTGLGESTSELNDEIKSVTEETKVQAKTIADYKAEIDSLRESLDLLNIGEGKQAEAIRIKITTLQDLINKTLDYETAIKSPSIVSEFTFPEIDFSSIDTDELTEILKALNDAIEPITPELTRAQAAAKSFGDEIMKAGIQGEGSLLDFARTAVNVAEKIIATYVAEAVAGAVKSALVNVPFPFNIAAAAIAGGLAAAAINAAIPDFAAGGAVSGPTMALVGEAPGISRSNPEYIGTAAQLSQMGGGGRTLVTRVSRGDLLFILNEGNASNTRNY